MVYTLFAAVLALSVTLTYSFKKIDDARSAGRAQTCQRIAALDDTLVGLIRGGEKSLPALSYYKNHPADLALVIKQDEAAVRALTPPAYC